MNRSVSSGEVKHKDCEDEGLLTDLQTSRDGLGTAVTEFETHKATMEAIHQEFSENATKLHQAAQDQVR